MKGRIQSGYGTYGFKSIDEFNVKTSLYGYVPMILREVLVVWVVGFVLEVCFHRRISRAG
jgi:hypothetical protein